MNNIHSCHQGTWIPLRHIIPENPTGEKLWKSNLETDILVRQGMCDGWSESKQLKKDKKRISKMGGTTFSWSFTPHISFYLHIYFGLFWDRVSMSFRWPQTQILPQPPKLRAWHGFVATHPFSYLLSLKHLGYLGLWVTPFICLFSGFPQPKSSGHLYLPRTTEMTSFKGFLALNWY